MNIHGAQTPERRRAALSPPVYFAGAAALTESIRRILARRIAEREKKQVQDDRECEK